MGAYFRRSGSFTTARPSPANRLSTILGTLSAAFWYRNGSAVPRCRGRAAAAPRCRGRAPRWAHAVSQYRYQKCPMLTDATPPPAGRAPPFGPHPLASPPWAMTRCACPGSLHSNSLQVLRPVHPSFFLRQRPIWGTSAAKGRAHFGNPRTDPATHGICPL